MMLDLAGSALRDKSAAEAPGAGAEIDDVIGASDGFGIGSPSVIQF